MAPGSVFRAALGREKLDAVVERVRARIRSRYEASAVVLTRSGTHALILALRIASRATGSDRVALPAYGCYAVATAAVGAGSRVDFYDVDPATLAADPATTRRALDRGSEVFLFAHLYGHPGASQSVLGRARDSGALLVEDAAQAAGGSLDGRPLGALGDLTVLSFGRGKGVTCGGGGALLVRGSRVSDDLVAGVRSELAGDRVERPDGWRELAVAAAQWVLGRPSLYRIPASMPFLGLGETRYREPTSSEPIADRAVRLLREALPEGPDPDVAARRRRARRLAALLDPVHGVRVLHSLPGGRTGALRLPLLLRGRGGGAPALGVLPGYPRLLSELGVVERPSDASGFPTPGAAELRDDLLTAPTHGLVEDRDLRTVARWAKARVGSGAADLVRDSGRGGEPRFEGAAGPAPTAAELSEDRP